MIGAVDIGGTKISVGQVRQDCVLSRRLECPTDAARGYSHALEGIAGMSRQTACLAKAEMKGIGIGCTGPIYPFTGEIGVVDCLPGWERKNPGQGTGLNLSGASNCTVAYLPISLQTRNLPTGLELKTPLQLPPARPSSQATRSPQRRQLAHRRIYQSVVYHGHSFLQCCNDRGALRTQLWIIENRELFSCAHLDRLNPR
jgi:hypothetical protein